MHLCTKKNRSRIRSHRREACHQKFTLQRRPQNCAAVESLLSAVRPRVPSHIQSGALELSEWPCASCALTTQYSTRNFYLDEATLRERATLGGSLPSYSVHARCVSTHLAFMLLASLPRRRLIPANFGFRRRPWHPLRSFEPPLSPENDWPKAGLAPLLHTATESRSRAVEGRPGQSAAAEIARPRPSVMVRPRQSELSLDATCAPSGGSQRPCK